MRSPHSEFPSDSHWQTNAEIDRLSTSPLLPLSLHPPSSNDSREDHTDPLVSPTAAKLGERGSFSQLMAVLSYIRPWSLLFLLALGLAALVVLLDGPVLSPVIPSALKAFSVAVQLKGATRGPCSSPSAPSSCASTEKVRHWPIEGGEAFLRDWRPLSDAHASGGQAGPGPFPSLPELIADLSLDVDIPCSKATPPPSSPTFQHFAVLSLEGTGESSLAITRLLRLSTAHPHICFLVLTADSDITASDFPHDQPTKGSEGSLPHHRLILISDAVLLRLPYRVVRLKLLDTVTRLNVGYLLAIHAGASFVWDLRVEDELDLHLLPAVNDAAFFSAPAIPDLELLAESEDQQCSATSPPPLVNATSGYFYTEQGSVRMHHKGGLYRPAVAPSNAIPVPPPATKAVPHHCAPVVQQVWAYDKVTSPTRPTGSMHSSPTFVLPADVLIPHPAHVTLHAKEALWALQLPPVQDRGVAMIWRDLITHWLSSYLLISSMESYNTSLAEVSPVWASPCTLVVESRQLKAQCAPSNSTNPLPSVTQILRQVMAQSMPGSGNGLDEGLYSERAEDHFHTKVSQSLPEGQAFSRTWLKAYTTLYEHGLLDASAVNYVLDWMQDLGAMRWTRPSSSSSLSPFYEFPRVPPRQRSIAVCIQFNFPPRPRVLARLLSVQSPLHEHLTIVTPSPLSSIHDMSGAHFPSRVHHIECIPSDMRKPLSAEEYRLRKEKYAGLTETADAPFEVHQGNDGSLQHLCAAECFRHYRQLHEERSSGYAGVLWQGDDFFIDYDLLLSTPDLFRLDYQWPGQSRVWSYPSPLVNPLAMSQMTIDTMTDANLHETAHFGTITSNPWLINDAYHILRQHPTYQQSWMDVYGDEQAWGSWSIADIFYLPLRQADQFGDLIDWLTNPQTTRDETLRAMGHIKPPPPQHQIEGRDGDTTPSDHIRVVDMWLPGAREETKRLQLVNHSSLWPFSRLVRRGMVFCENFNPTVLAMAADLVAAEDEKRALANRSIVSSSDGPIRCPRPLPIMKEVEVVGRMVWGADRDNVTLLTELITPSRHHTFVHPLKLTNDVHWAMYRQRYQQMITKRLRRPPFDSPTPATR